MPTELISLQNAANYFQNLSVREKFQKDKRKTTKKYFLVLNADTSISPVLDYEQLNHFILGMIKASKLNLLTK
jgi:hypothetical protein